MENLNYIRELLDELSRYQNAGHISLVQTDLSICLDRITSSFRPALDYLGISFETDIPRDLPQISLDQTKIRQALFNLLRNAQESIQLYSRQKSFFPLLPFRTVSSITISDNGCGMTEDQIETPSSLRNIQARGALASGLLSPGRSLKPTRVHYV